MDENDKMKHGFLQDDPFFGDDGPIPIRPELALRRTPEALPSDARAERAVVAAVLASAGDCYEDVVKVVPVSALYDSGWRIVLEAVGTLREANLAADGPSVIEYLMTRRVDDGGPPYVERVVWEGVRGPAAILDAVADAPLPVSVSGYARKVAELAVRRQGVLDARRILALAESTMVPLSDVRKQLEEAAERMRTVEAGRPDWQHIGALAVESIDQTRAIMEGRPSGVISTGIPALDKAIGGGFNPGDFVVIGGRPGHGKTAIVMSMAVKTARLGNGVAVFSLELMNSVAARRVLAQVSRVDTMTLKTGRDAMGRPVSDDDIRRMVDAAADLERYPLWINDRPAQTLASIRSGIRRMKGVCPELRLVVVDYLQIMGLAGGKNDSLNNMLAHTAQTFRNMAKEENVAILALSQLGREIEKRADPKPRMSDLRDSGGIEAAATHVLFPWRKELLNPNDATLKGQASILIAKQTDGEADQEVPVKWHGQYQEFADEEERYERATPRRANVIDYPRAGGDGDVPY